MQILNNAISSIYFYFLCSEANEQTISFLAKPVTKHFQFKQAIVYDYQYCWSSLNLRMPEWSLHQNHLQTKFLKWLAKAKDTFKRKRWSLLRDWRSTWWTLYANRTPWSKRLFSCEGSLDFSSLVVLFMYSLASGNELNFICKKIK